MPKKTLDEFMLENDPATVIKRLQSDLAEARTEGATAAAVLEALGILGGKARADRDPPKWLQAKPTTDSFPGVPSLFISDIHYDEQVKPEQIQGMNEFNRAIADRRLEYTFQQAVDLSRLIQGWEKIPGIVCKLGGDMISGNIHDELVATNQFNTMPTILALRRRLIAGLTLLAEAYGSVFVPCVTGNHGRNTKKIWSKDRHHTSFDWLLYQLLAEHFEAVGDKRIQFFIPEGSDALYRVYDVRYLLTHGDQFKSGDSIIGAIGPVFRGNQKKLARNQSVGLDYDMLCVGHWHSYLQTPRLEMNGSVKGYDEYAFQGNFAFEHARQAFHFTHPVIGLSWSAPIYCEKMKGGKPNAKWVSHI